MGAVQKLATVVIIGLVALATVLTVYIAGEPDRRGTEASEQEDIAIVRGTDLYITYCLQCHGPSGLGTEGPESDPARIGPALNKEGAGIPEDPPETFVNFQSDDPAEQALAEDFIRYRIVNGVPSDPRFEKLMPAFAADLNVEEINDLVYLVMNGDWNYVYNQSVLTTGETVAQAECDENNGEGEYCDNIEEAPPVYPTAPPQATPEEEEAGDEEAAGDVAAELEAQDPATWGESQLTLQPGDTIAVTNTGVLEHDFAVDELGISEDLPNNEAVMITIPDDAEPGEYEFYCSVPGHREQGMVGTLTIEGGS